MLKPDLRVLWRIVLVTMTQWMAHRSPRLGAALAYYSVFSMGPLLLLVIAVAGFFFGDDAVRGSLRTQFTSLLGSSGSAELEAMLATAASRSSSRVAAIAGIALVLIAAVGIVAQLKDAMNTIWNVRDPKRVRISWYVRTYLISFAGVLVLGLLLVISLVFNAALAAVSVWLGGDLATTWEWINFLVSFGLLTVLFGMLFKWFPDTDITWRDVWLGAAFTALLFNVGKLAIGWYVGFASFESTYGAAASIIVLLVWVYYSAQIVLLGAEFTHAFASETGSRKRQGPDATAAHKLDTEAKCGTDM